MFCNCSRATIGLPLALLLGALPCLAQDKKAPTSLTFKRVPVKAGEQIRETKTSSLSLKALLRINGKVAQDIDQWRALNIDKTITFKALKGEQLSKARIAYKKQELKTRAGEESVRTDKGLEGRAVLIERQPDGFLRVARDGGDKLTKEQRALVREEEAALFAGPRFTFVSVIAAKPRRFGELITLDKAQTASLFGDADDFEMGSLKGQLKLKDCRKIKDAECGVFEVTITGVGQKQGTTTTLTLVGEVWVETGRGRVRRLDLKGGLKMDGGQRSGSNEMSFKGSGELSVKQRFDDLK